MKWIKFFEDFKLNNKEGDLLTINDVIECINKNGVLYTNIVIDYPDNDPETPLKPLSVDEDGLITISTDDGDEYNTHLKNIIKLET